MVGMEEAPVALMEREDVADRHSDDHRDFHRPSVVRVELCERCGVALEPDESVRCRHCPNPGQADFVSGLAEYQRDLQERRRWLESRDEARKAVAS